MWSFSNSSRSSRNSARTWEYGPKTPKRRSKSRSKEKGGGKGKDQKGKAAGKSGKDGGYASSESAQPWQQSSMLATLGITAPESQSQSQPSKIVPKDTDLEGILKGLKSHLRAHGQELPTEADAYFAQKSGSSTLTIKAASMRLESSQKNIKKVKAEILQQQAAWKKFQEALSKEYDTQLEKHKEKLTALQDSLKKSQEDYSEAKKSLQEAADVSEELNAAAAEEGKKSPKRAKITEAPEKEDELKRKLREKPVVVTSDDEDMPAPTAQKGVLPVPGFG